MKNIKTVDKCHAVRKDANCRQCGVHFEIGDVTIRLTKGRSKQHKWYHLKCYEEMGY